MSSYQNWIQRSGHLNTTSFESWLQTSAAVHHRHWIPLGTMHKEVLHLPGGHGWSPSPRPLHCYTPRVSDGSLKNMVSKLEISLSSSSHSGFHVKLLRGIIYHPPRSCGQMASFAAAAADTRPVGVNPEVANHWQFVCCIHLFSRGTFDLDLGERTKVAASPKSCPRRSWPARCSWRQISPYTALVGLATAK